MGLVDPDPGQGPLAQGDIIKDVVMHTTTLDGRSKAIKDRALVISRNCNAARESTILVAAIVQFKSQALVDIETFRLDDMRRRLCALRDGDGTPDTFYLGQLDHTDTRYCAKLNSIFTIELHNHEAQASDRRNWIQERRIARLTSDHRRHLHQRILGAVSPEGFEDVEWLCDADLAVLIDAGHAEYVRLESAKSEENQAIHKISFTGNPQDARNLKSRGEKVRKIEGSQDALNDLLRPFDNEWHRRHGRFRHFKSVK